MILLQAQIVREIAQAQPGLQIIINHCGSPIDRDPGRDAALARRIEADLGLPNLAIQVDPAACSPPRTLESVRAVAMHCVKLFWRRAPQHVWHRLSQFSKIHMNFNQIYEISKPSRRP